MSCAISIGGGDCDGYPEFHNRQELKARKAYVCLECRVEIEPGQMYFRDTGKFDGEFYSEKTCAACADIAASFQSPEGGGAMGSLWEEMREQFRDLTTACFDQLETVEGKRKLREEWMKWKGLAA